MAEPAQVNAGRSTDAWLGEADDEEARRGMSEDSQMVVRMWRGRVPTEKAVRYREFLNARAIPDYQSVQGNVSVHILERHDGPVTHFVMLTFWRDMADIRAFAGDPVDTAKYYPEDQDFLLEFEPKVVHYDVVGQAVTPTR